jgi:hypothetical protein
MGLATSFVILDTSSDTPAAKKGALKIAEKKFSTYESVDPPSSASSAAASGASGASTSGVKRAVEAPVAAAGAAKGPAAKKGKK